jgi:hypothetical protein
MKPNSLLLAGAICGLLIWGGFTQLQNTWRNKHPNSLVITTEDDYGQHQKTVAQYKRERYVGAALMLVFGIGGWIGILWLEKKEKEKQEAKRRTDAEIAQEIKRLGPL